MARITQIFVRGRPVGIVGLEEAMDDAERENLGYEEARNFLLERIRRRNYIPAGLEAEYQDAMARLYCERRGIPLPESPKGEPPFLTIRVLGPGCASCQRLEQEVMAATSELNIPADILHVTDVREIASYGVMGTPALVINGKVVSTGKIPSRASLKEAILRARGEGGSQERKKGG
jgi:small redox-active disulfide protein 2